MTGVYEAVAIGEVVIAGEAHSAQPGTSGWSRLGADGAGS